MSERERWIEGGSKLGGKGEWGWPAAQPWCTPPQTEERSIREGEIEEGEERGWVVQQHSQ